MNEYRIKGLSCGGCALRMEEEIKQLEHGSDAKLSYNSGKLTVDPQISMAAVKKILKSDNAYIEASSEANTGHDHSSHSHAGHDHDHDHSHSEGHSNMLKLLIVSGIIYVAALFLDGVLDKQAVILLYLTATIISGYTTFFRGLKNLIKMKFNIDTLMTIALIGAVSIGEWKEATLVAILFGLNELLEGYGMEKARRSMEALFQVAPKEALKVENGQEIIVPIASLQIGDLVKIKPGEKIPSDGIVSEGKSSVNEAAITGESLRLRRKLENPFTAEALTMKGCFSFELIKHTRIPPWQKFFISCKKHRKQKRQRSFSLINSLNIIRRSL